MDLLDRAVFFGVGVGFGFMLGYMVARLNEIKEELDVVLENERKRSDDGFIRSTFWMNATLLLVVCITAWAAFASQSASNKAGDVQDKFQKISQCNEQFLGKTIVALNERTASSQSRANSNVEVQKSELAFLKLRLIVPAVSDAELAAGLKKYVDDMEDFINTSEDVDQSLQADPYPTKSDFTDCLNKED